MSKIKLFFTIIIFISCQCCLAQNDIIPDSLKASLEKNNSMFHFRFNNTCWGNEYSDKLKVINPSISDSTKFTTNIQYENVNAILFKNSNFSFTLEKPAYIPEFSLSFWFRPSQDLGNNKATFIRMPNGGIQVYYYMGELVVEVENQSSNGTSRSRVSRKFIEDQWYFIHINGKENKPLELTINRDTYNLELIGAKLKSIEGKIYCGSNEKNENFYNGSLDDLALYNRNLTTKEIANLYKLKAKRYLAPIPDAIYKSKIIRQLKKENGELNVSASFVSDLKIDEVQIYRNGELIRQMRSPSQTIGFGNYCGIYAYAYECKINWQVGNNIIGYKAINQAGETYVERVFDYKPEPAQVAETKTEKTILANQEKTVIKDIGPRVALVIGNADYATSGKLKNPVNDAKAVSTELEKLNFKVFKIENASRIQILKIKKVYLTELAKDTNTTGLLYYAGHGIQANNKNYMIPVDATIEIPADVKDNCIEIDGIIADLIEAKNNMNIIILDACRNNPFERSITLGGLNRDLGIGQGLKGMELEQKKAKGLFIAFATAPGAVAADGKGDNSTYTQEFINTLKLPGLKIEDVFKKVRINVAKLTNNDQMPWDNSSLVGDFYFNLK